MSQHPTFGSYQNPVPFKVESSPYYWWWYALTLNEDYKKACDNGGTGFEQTYAEFGDVRYEGERHYAFCSWWRERVNTLEARGAYLFAEPVLRGKSVSVIDDEDVAVEVIADANRLLVSIPLDAQRKHIEWRLDKILKKHLKPETGRLVRSVKKSKALYSMHKPVVPAALKKCFDLYDAKQLALENGKAVSNIDLAKRVGIKVKEREKDEIYTVANYRRTVSATVSRYIKQAENMIENSARGQFP